MNKRTRAYRSFSFGRRHSDGLRCPAIMSLPRTTEDIAEKARELVLEMESSAELKEAILAELQRNSYCVMSFDNQKAG